MGRSIIWNNVNDERVCQLVLQTFVIITNLVTFAYIFSTSRFQYNSNESQLTSLVLFQDVGSAFTISVAQGMCVTTQEFQNIFETNKNFIGIASISVLVISIMALGISGAAFVFMIYDYMDWIDYDKMETQGKAAILWTLVTVFLLYLVNATILTYGVQGTCDSIDAGSGCYVTCCECDQRFCIPVSTGGNVTQWYLAHPETDCNDIPVVSELHLESSFSAAITRLRIISLLYWFMCIAILFLFLLYAFMFMSLRSWRDRPQFRRL